MPCVLGYSHVHLELSSQHWISHSLQADSPHLPYLPSSDAGIVFICVL
jgi:hypothetical protein